MCASYRHLFNLLSQQKSDISIAPHPHCYGLRDHRGRLAARCMAHLLEPFNTFGWKPDSTLSEDENFMDLTLLVTRSSRLKQGSMACILVRTNEENELGEYSTIVDRIVSVATNQALYKENESDIHAEIAAIGQAARIATRPTADCTAYITMPPCRRCFAALLCAGVRRIVSRHVSPLAELAAKHGIEMLCIDDLDEHKVRVNAIVHSYKEQLTTDGVDAEREDSHDRSEKN
jgi:tRNA(Arg) A34 adenosine deaminase TadA